MGRGAGGIRPRGRSIQIDFYYKGVRCRETLKMEPSAKNIKYASNLKASIQRDIALGIFSYSKYFPESKKNVLWGERREIKVKDALIDYLDRISKRLENSTYQEYKSVIEWHLIPQFGEVYLSEVSSYDINTWISGLEVSNKRINNILIPFRGMFSEMFMEGAVKENPLDRVRNLPNNLREPDPFSPEEVKKILENCDSENRRLFQFAFWSGLRTSELIALQWKDISLEKKLVFVRRAKVKGREKGPKTSAGKREVMLLTPAKDALEEVELDLRNGKVFLNPKTGEPWTGDRQIRESAWTHILRKAGVRYRNPYHTRHTYASMLLSAGENPMWVASQMGHKDWGMIRKRYGRWIPSVDPTAGGKAELFWSQLGHQ